MRKLLMRYRAARALASLPVEDRICIEGGLSDEHQIDRQIFLMTYLGPFPCPLNGMGRWKREC